MVAHSLDLLIDNSYRNTKANTHYKYLEDYWIQPQFTRNIRGVVTDDNRIQIKLFKFNIRAEFSPSKILLFCIVMWLSSWILRGRGVFCELSNYIIMLSTRVVISVAGLREVECMFSLARLSLESSQRRSTRWTTAPRTPLRRPLRLRTYKRNSTEEESYNTFDWCEPPKKKLNNDMKWYLTTTWIQKLATKGDHYWPLVTITAESKFILTST